MFFGVPTKRALGISYFSGTSLPSAGLASSAAETNVAWHKATAKVERKVQRMIGKRVMDKRGVRVPGLEVCGILTFHLL